MSKYGLQLRSSQQKKAPRPSVPTVLGFGDDDDNDVEKEISRQATKNKSLKDIEEQHKKALEEDPSVFDYDEVYDEMKQKIVQPKAQDREERKSKYIETLMKKAEDRKRQQDVVYEKKLAKERSKDDHLYADKDKFVTSAYKKKLAEQEKWIQEERLRELREEKEDVTKKRDLSDLYFNLEKNVAFGAKDRVSREQEKQEKQTEYLKPEHHDDRVAGETSNRNHASPDSRFSSETCRVQEAHQNETSPPKIHSDPLDPKPVSGTSEQERSSAEQSSVSQPKQDHHKRDQDALASAKERYLARKRAKEQ